MHRDRRQALAALSALWLSACGGGGSDSTAGAPPAGAPPAPAPIPGSPSSPPPPPPPPGPAPAPGTTRYGDLSQAALGVGASLNGAVPFPSGNAWNTDISATPVDPNSDALIASIGLGTGLHPDFGAGLYNGAPIGIPYVVVAGTQTPVAMHWMAYGDEIGRAHV